MYKCHNQLLQFPTIDKYLIHIHNQKHEYLGLESSIFPGILSELERSHVGDLNLATHRSRAAGICCELNFCFVGEAVEVIILKP